MNRLILAALLSASALAAPPALAQTTLSAVTLSITFSDKALAELNARGEGVVVAGYWMGDPAPGATLPVSEIGTIFLQTEELTLLPGPVTVSLGHSLSAAPLDQVVEPALNVNVYSARWSDEHNLLNCDIVDDLLSNLTQPQAIHCKLIGE